MSQRMVTVATFHDTLEAAVAKNFLEGQGIPAVLIDDDTIAMDWMLAGAIGGIKLQVEPIHAERAEMLIAQVQEDKKVVADEPPPPATAIAAQEIAEDIQAEREDKEPINKLVDQLFRCAVFGLVLVPLQLYALYLMASVWGAEGKVSPNRRWKVWVSILLNYAIMGSIAMPIFWLLNQFESAPATPDNPRWRTYQMPTRGFSVRFPHEPSLQTSVLGRDRFGQNHATGWTAWANTRTYRVTILHHGDAVKEVPAEQVLKDNVDEILDTEDAKLVSNEPIEWAGRPGREFVLDFPNYRERSKCCMRGQDVVTVSVFGTPEEVTSEEAEQFFQSFRFR